MTEGLVRVLLVADDAFLRQGLRRKLRVHGVCVVADAAGAGDALPAVRRTQPDVVVIDVDGLGAGSARELIESLDPTSRPQFVAMAQEIEPEAALSLLAAGVGAYVSKGAPIEHLRLAVSAASLGISALSADVLALLVDMRRASEDQTTAHSGASPDLTDRELEILGLVVDGADNQEIGTRLLLSSSTVKTDVSSILTKLHSRNRLQAAVFAVKRNLV